MDFPLIEKLKTQEEIKSIAKRLKNQGETIVTLNGSFDLLHAGHLKIIRQAKNQGDRLIIGLNSDNSVKSNKGEERPIINEKARAEMLDAIRFIDYIVILDAKDISIPLIKLIKPHVHVNGSEYGENCIEADTLKSVGGRLYVVEKEQGLSTSDIIKKIKSLNNSGCLTTPL